MDIPGQRYRAAYSHTKFFASWADNQIIFLKRQRFINKCKQATWRRWSNDYFKALRERYNMECKKSIMQIKEGDANADKIFREEPREMGDGYRV